MLKPLIGQNLFTELRKKCEVMRKEFSWIYRELNFNLNFGKSECNFCFSLKLTKIFHKPLSRVIQNH